MRGIIFRTAKAAFRKAYRKHKSSVKRAKTEKKKRGLNIPVVPYNLIKSDIKRKIKGTKFTAAAEFKAQPGLKRRIRVGIERAKREKKKFRTPIMYGKAYASDKKGKTMQIQPLTAKQRKQMKKEMAESANRNYLKVRKRSLGYNKGGMKTVKMVKSKLEKASAAHAGQAKALGKVIDKKKMLVGGLLTAGIKGAARKLFKSGTRKTQQIVKESGGTRKDAKSDVKAAISNELKGKLRTKEYSISSPFYNKKLRRQLVRDINLLKK
jgi:hypothetical protein